MTTLISAQPLTYADGRAEIYATWQDEIGTYAIIHDTNGLPVVTPEGVTASALTADQVAAALTPPVHPAHALAAKGAAARPELAERMSKAAELVEGGAVRLTGPETAVVNEYAVTAESCACKDFEHHAPGGWCKHRLAVRMARALGQAVQPVTEAEKETAVAERIEAERARVLARVNEGNYKMQQETAKSYRDGDGARRWMWSHLAHNGYKSVPAEFYQRAAAPNRQAELERVKAEALASIRARRAAEAATTGGQDHV